ncbi:hypothetical protein ACFFSH_38785 [Streptomyces filamentosus]|uniref:Uncharacterized protein n=1 Tax=Streptomyces filamentosus TaxID=67294 RepID=A0A919BQ65_STRFL|nr:hypothetical protein [Streptomyces filamentosus]GHG05346.1 hypothetical protein GCM10017667_40200 [Streptomyces filamentosus]
MDGTFSPFLCRSRPLHCPYAYRCDAQKERRHRDTSTVEESSGEPMNADDDLPQRARCHKDSSVTKAALQHAEIGKRIAGSSEDAVGIRTTVGKAHSDRPPH